MTAPSGAMAQQPPLHPAAPRPALQHAGPQTEAPQSTTATYNDWMVQCVIRAGQPAAKTCDMVQVTQVQGNNLPFSRVALTHPEKGRPVKLVVQVPVNASFSENVRIQAGGTEPALTAPFTRCVPAGCFAEFALSEETIRRLHAASGAGKLSFLDATGRNITVPLSLKGFAQAFDALAKE